ncbi:MAG TPA: hypothetical protein VIK89_16770 [Cytophagaceae bacterium]
MTNKVTLVLALALFSVILCTELKAQNVYFTGLGRALVTNDQLTDETDPASKLKSSGGYTLFDLGVYANPNEVLRGGVILRVRNEFGGFFGDGASLEFRQMQLEGLIAKKVKYEIGDIYLTHTPYTLWNKETMYSKYESNVFALRRDIVNYENFYVGNAWRMQGFNTKAKVNFAKGADSLGIRVYGGRTMETDYIKIPDRYFYGGKLDLAQSKYFRIAGNLAGISDIAGTVKEAEVSYNNLVYTTDFTAAFEKEDKWRFAINGEAGASKFELSRVSDSINKSFEDFFYDIGTKATYKPLGLNFGVSYRNVGFNFNSPMAQTRRVAAPNDITLSAFPTMNDRVSLRRTSLYDFYGQENTMYNQSISTTLMDYYIQYDMVEPYGKATPNRKGITFSADMQEPEKLFNAGIEVNLLSEVVSEGDSITNALRNFTLIRGGFVFNVNQLIGFEKLIAVNAGIRNESSKRGGTNSLNLSSSLIDLGLDVEVIKDLHLLGGAKFFKVNGMEIQTGRDEVNQIVSYGTGTKFNQQQNIIAAGLRYDYDKAGYFSMHYHIVDFKDKDTALQSYDFNQWFFVFGLKF